MLRAKDTGRSGRTFRTTRRGTIPQGSFFGLPEWVDKVVFVPVGCAKLSHPRDSAASSPNGPVSEIFEWHSDFRFHPETDNVLGPELP